MTARAHPNKPSAVFGGSGSFCRVLFTALTAVVLCAFQFGDRNNLNSMPFAQVKLFVSDLPKAERLAKQGNIELLAGAPVHGQPVKLRGELTDANCYLSKHRHAYDHAFCAKLCLGAGSPLVFLPDQGGQVYMVLTSRNGIKIPDSVLDKVGVPGILVSGKILSSNNVAALALQGIEKPSAGAQHQ